MARSDTGYRVSALVVGLGSLIACGGGGTGASSNNGAPATPATEAQKVQVASLVPGFMKTGGLAEIVADSLKNARVKVVAGDQGVFRPTPVPDLAHASGYGTTQMLGSNTTDIRVPNMKSGSILFTYSESGTAPMTTFDGTLTFKDVTYQAGLNQASVNGSIALNCSITSNSSGVTYTTDISTPTKLLFSDGSNHSWTALLDHHVTGSISGTLPNRVLKRTEYGTANYTGPQGTYSVSILQNNPLTYDSSQCLLLPISGAMSWTADNNSVANVTLGPGCGSFAIDGEVHTLN